MDRRALFTELKPEIRARSDGKRTISGYGAVFYDADDTGTEYRLWEDVVERIMPGAFDRAMKEDDVRSLFNHDSNIVLGRTKSGTLRLSVDAVGLRYEIDAPDTQLVRDQVIAPLERGDVDGSSFMFVPTRTAWIEEAKEGRTLYIRQIEEVELSEVGPVTFPAYESSTSGVRSSLEAEIEQIKREKDAGDLQADEVVIKADVVKIDGEA
jgi:uncharacterized protein